MSLNLSAIAVRERAVTLFFILLLAAAGAYAFVMLGRAEDPDLHHQDPDGHDGMAGRDGARDAGPRRRTAGEAASGADLVRPGGDDHAAGLCLS